MERAEKREARRTPDRKDRVPMGGFRSRLPKAKNDPNFVYRIFNDNWVREPERIQRAKEAGYEVVARA